jgi:thioredoxin reductase (NADPH)
MIQQEKLVILGSGPAGLSAGIYAGRAGLSPLIIEGDEPGGQLMTTTLVENWPGDMSVQGPALMKRMRDHAAYNKVQFLAATVLKTDLSKSPFVITTARSEIHSHALIIATGATPKRLNCPGESEYWGKGVTTCAICDGAFYRDMPVVIVGGGDTAMENASFLTNFTQSITIVHISNKLSASQAMQARIINNPQIKIIYSSTVTAIEGDGKKVHSVTVTNQETQEAHKLMVNGVFIAIGLTPNTQLFKDQLDLTPYGYIKLVEHTQTSIPGVFAAGDVADARYRQAIVASGAGCAAMLDAERYLKQKGI